ncbi:hypothetical protein IFM89_006787 [Coptis chinensis]|uniref:RNase H type-1 domain-containing protein n=1 Tax=Coptis chinensis TaxID=261450 RepID=A0A835ICF5_9MAGN|nr:hypothetical protein IFM89_006787 [Coptis chinensis]
MLFISLCAIQSRVDNVWTYDANHWNPINFFVAGGAVGSRILVTKHNEKVADVMGFTYKHKLGELSEDDYWSLFNHIVFQGREEDLSKFEEIGKTLTKKCKGVPLPTKTLAEIKEIANTREIKQFLQTLRLQVKLNEVIVVPCYWTKPDEGIVKLNSDGDVNSRGASSGGIIRDSGDTIIAYIGTSFNNSFLFQELIAIHHELSICRQLGFLKVLVESDSLRAVHAIKTVEASPWQILDMVPENGIRL